MRSDNTLREYEFCKRHFVISLGAVALLLAVVTSLAEDVPVIEAKLVQQFDAQDARQGVAADSKHFYAVNNFSISKHDKQSGKVVDEWRGRAEGDPLIHMDSLVVVDGRLYASHSNYPEWPMTSSIEVWDAATMQHVETHSFGVYRGSLTWLDRYDSAWWATFANYDKVQRGQSKPYGLTNNTQVVKLDDTFSELQSWTLPVEILNRMRPMSNSGGSWGPDGRLYLTGHDHGEIYVMQIPAAGSVLDWVATVIVPVIEGQGIAWDRSDPGHFLWGINKGQRKVVKIEMPTIILE